jgi:hypothetical protein
MSEHQFTIYEATRSSVKQLIGLFGLSSGGKTHSALLLARGIVGPKGRIAVLDSENKRASYFADMPPGPTSPGKYFTVDLDSPFSPERYVAALKYLEDKADIVVLDSATHWWSGEGGVIDLHEAALDRMTRQSTDWKERERLNWPAWREPKLAHKAGVMYLLRYPLPLIVCLRGKVQTKMMKGANGRNEVVTAAHPVPDFDDKFIFEFLVAGEVYRDEEKGISGLLRVTKISRSELQNCLPKEGEQIGIRHGEALAAWCSGGSAPKAAPSKDERGKLLGELRDCSTKIHGWTRAAGAEAWPAAKVLLQRFITDELAIDTLIDGMTEDELRSTISKAKNKLTPQNLL